MPGMRQTDQVSQDEDQREEDYEKLFNKIGRDFVTIKDLEEALGAIPGVSINVGNAHAVAQANEYKENLNAGQKQKKKYNDLIKLEDDDEETDEEVAEEEETDTEEEDE
jgi:hypothetical protein